MFCGWKELFSLAFKCIMNKEGASVAVTQRSIKDENFILFPENNERWFQKKKHKKHKESNF